MFGLWSVSRASGDANRWEKNDSMRPFCSLTTQLAAIIRRYTAAANMDSSRRTRIARERVNLSRYIIRAPGGSSRRSATRRSRVPSFFVADDAWRIINKRQRRIQSELNLKRRGGWNRGFKTLANEARGSRRRETRSVDKGKFGQATRRGSVAGQSPGTGYAITRDSTSRARLIRRSRVFANNA